MKHPLRAGLGVVCLLSTLTGCAPVVIGGAAATGVLVAHDRRTAGTMVDDQTIELKAHRLLSEDKELTKDTHINVTSYNLVATLTGEVPNPQMKAKAGEIVKSIPRVRRVNNELGIAAPSSLMSRASDSVITGKVKVALLKIDELPGFDPTRVKVVTERGTVYLMGLLTHKEAAAVINKSRQVDGVQRVVALFEYID